VGVMVKEGWGMRQKQWCFITTFVYTADCTICCCIRLTNVAVSVLGCCSVVPPATFDRARVTISRCEPCVCVMYAGALRLMYDTRVKVA